MTAVRVRCDDMLDHLLDSALARREPLLCDRETTCCRLFHGVADGEEGLVIDRFGEVLIVQTQEGRFKRGLSVLRAAMQWVCQRLGARAVYRKVFLADRAKMREDVVALHKDPQPWIGEPVEPVIEVRENDLRFIVRPYDGFAVGLFLEHRENRRRVRELAAGKRVLNAFAYTCGFSMAAAAGGAASVSSLDLSKRYLEWGKENFAASGLPLDGHLFFCSDVFDFCARARRQGRRYDLVVLDPPTFARTRRPKRSFVLADDLRRLLSETISLLDPGGLLLFATNARQISMSHIEEELAAAAGQRGWQILDRPALPPDFASDADYSKSVLVRVE